MLGSLSAVLPELIVATAACLALVVDALRPTKNAISAFIISLVALALVFFLSFGAAGEASGIMSGQVIADRFGAVAKMVIVAVVFIVLCYSHPYLAARSLAKGEYYVLALLSTAGMLVLVSSGNLVTVYLGVELMSLCLYAMVAFDRDNPGAGEAAMKYFILGAIASAVLLLIMERKWPNFLKNPIYDSMQEARHYIEQGEMESD